MVSSTTQNTDFFGSFIRRVYAFILVGFGLTLVVGGALLMASGGSLYYLAAGLAIMASGVLVWCASRLGVWLYGAMLVGTVAWSIWEVRFDAWALLPRLVVPFVIGLGLLLPSVRKAGEPIRISRGISGGPALVVGLAGAILVGWAANAAGPGRPADPVWQVGNAVPAPERLPQPLADVSGGEWHHWGNDRGGTRFSPLEEINTSNVARLQVAWEADFGPGNKGRTGAMQATPLMVGDTLYLCNMANEIIAYDAETGSERWRHDMTADMSPAGRPCRGVAYHRAPEANGACAARIISPTQTAELVAVDATTGEVCKEFGDNGRINLREGLREAPLAHYYISSAPQIVRGKIVVGGPVLDGQIWNGPSGVIRAYDAVTGQLAWAFDVGNPERQGVPGPGEEYTPSTPNSWAPISADEELGLVYLPIGNTNGSDYYGGMRRPFDDAISSSVIALDAETGRLRWTFQTLHHDIWDYDVASQPTLVDLPTADGVRRALIQPSKRGDVFVIDRVTGEPIKPVAELPVPQGGIAEGERLSPTQPFSVGMPSFRGPDLREADMWGITPLDQMICRLQFVRSRYEGHLTPLTPGKPTIISPGYGGGSNWGSASVDVDRGILITNTNRMPNRMTLITRDEAERQGVSVYSGEGAASAARPQMNTPYAITGGPFLSTVTGAPCIRPPYGVLTATDLASGRVIWTKPLGTARDSGPFGMASHLPVEMGTPVVGGSLVTRGGLTFIAATQERTFRAFDTTTGELLWQTRLPGGGNAVPMTYRAPKSGRQFVVIAAPGNAGLRSQRSTKLVAFALPQE